MSISKLLSKLLPEEAGYDRKASEEAYRDAMKAVYDAAPKDADAAGLYALAIFYAAGYDNWTKEGKPTANWQEMIDVLEAGLKLHPKHLGLTHTYIHAVEESPHPERALPAADALRGLKIFTPSFGHLVHMPAHIYVRTGNFQTIGRIERADGDDADGYFVGRVSGFGITITY